MIESLTAEQIAKFPEYVERWTAIGLSTAPADRPAAELAIYGIYTSARLTPPSKILWCESPLAFMTAIKNEKITRINVWENVWNNVWDNVRQNVWSNVWHNVLHNVRHNVFQNIWHYDFISNEIAYLAFYQYCHDVLGLAEQTKSLRDFWELAQISGGAVFYRDECFILERPNILKLDTRGRLHCEGGPAMAYCDGFAIYAIHGVRIPTWIIEQPDRLSINTIDLEMNSEIQRVMIERFGWERYASECGAIVLDHSERWGTLYQRTSLSGVPVLFVHVTNRTAEPDGSFRQYILPVHHQCRPLPDPANPNGRLGEQQVLTALNAVASTFGLTGEEYGKLKLKNES